MRKLTILPLAAALLLAAAGPVSAGANTSNTSGSGRTIQGEWYDTTSSGYVVLFEESGGSFGEFLAESGEWTLCNPGASPEEEIYGFVGTRIWGWSSDVAISMTSKLTAASATGTFDIGVDTIDECTGTYDSTYDTAAISVDLVGEGSLVTFRNSGSFHVPGEFNAHGQYRGQERSAAGSIDLGSFGSHDLDFAVMAQYRWTDHTNG